MTAQPADRESSVGPSTSWDAITGYVTPSIEPVARRGGVFIAWICSLGRGGREINRLSIDEVTAAN